MVTHPWLGFKSAYRLAGRASSLPPVPLRPPQKSRVTEPLARFLRGSSYTEWGRASRQRAGERRERSPRTAAAASGPPRRAASPRGEKPRRRRWRAPPEPARGSRAAPRPPDAGGAEARPFRAAAAPGSRGRPNGAKATVARLPGGAGAFPPAAVVFRCRAGAGAGGRVSGAGGSARSPVRVVARAEPRAVPLLKGARLRRRRPRGRRRHAGPGAGPRVPSCRRPALLRPALALRDVTGLGSCRSASQLQMSKVTHLAFIMESSGGELTLPLTSIAILRI
ncbi:uncharacterized protein LOC142066937 [Phalacrocorax aristotelis]|uniref:uncharacterized protein LOC142066937 n=1 Tax=Phalacrocorax aristotelis TaxID=126867 RepID=UPI003F4B38C4